MRRVSRRRRFGSPADTRDILRDIHNKYVDQTKGQPVSEINPEYTPTEKALNLTDDEIDSMDHNKAAVLKWMRNRPNPNEPVSQADIELAVLSGEIDWEGELY